MRFSMLKRIGALMLALFMCVSMFPATAFATDDEAPEHQHVWSEWTTVTAATCAADGLQQRTCAGCEGVETAGIALLPHSFGDWSVVTPATCSAQGVQQHVCTVCGATETTAVDRLPHSFGEWTVTKNPTCTEAGEQQHTCTVCGATETAAVDKLPHSFGEWTLTKNPTCTEAGEQQHTCTVCGATETAAVDKLPHSFGEWTVTKNPTCTEAGEQQHTCTVCGETETAAVDKLPHSFSAWTVTKDPTCTKEGKQEHTCTVCGRVESESVPMLPHSFGAWTVTKDPTCTKEGKQEHACAACGKVETESIEMLPHSFDDWEVTKEPTCDKEGKQERECSVCGTKETEKLAMLPHTFGEWEVTREPSCDKEGKKEATCEVCGQTVTEKIPMIDHSFGEWEVKRESTCTQEGKKERKCEVCEAVEKEYLPLADHEWDDDGKCTVCGEKDPDKAKTYTVTWQDEDGTLLEKDEQVAKGTVPSFDGETPAKDEDDDYTYKFSGWDPEPVPVTEDAVYTAQFTKKEKPFTVTFNPANGEESVRVSVESGSAIGAENMPADPTKKDYDFEKWVNSEDRSTEITAETVVTGDMTAVAVYKVQMPAVSFHKSAGGVYVSVSAEEGTFPAGTTMTVIPLGSDSSLESMAGEGEEVVKTLVVDITFWFEGEEVQPEKPVAVTLGVAEYTEEQSIDVVHYADGGGASVVASDVAGTAASFAADHFSAYGVIVKAGPPIGMNQQGLIDSELIATSITDLVSDLGKKGFYISAQSTFSAHNVYYFTDETVVSDISSDDKTQVIKRTAANDITSAAKYYFEQIPNTETYKIYTTQGGENDPKYYITTSAYIKGRYHINLDKNNATPFTVSFKNDTVVIKQANKDCYLNLKSRDAGVGFQGYREDKSGSKSEFIMNLIFSEEIVIDKDPYELNGKEFAIIYYPEENCDVDSSDSKAMTSVITEGSLGSQTINNIKDGRFELPNDYSNISWIFESAGGGHYRLKISDTEYLKISSSTGAALVSFSEATVFSVSPGTPGGYTSTDKKLIDTAGRYRLSWTEVDNSEVYSTAALQSDFSGKVDNAGAQNTKNQWFYLAVLPYYTVTWVNDDGEVLETDEYVQYGATPSYDGETPTKAATAQYTYTFAGWTPEISAVTEDVTYTATYSSTVNKYTVTWKSQDGAETYETDANVEYGSQPKYDGAEPTKTADEKYTYTFAGWATEQGKESGTAVGDLPVVSKNVTYYAAFSKKEKIKVIVTISGVQDTVLYNGTARSIIGFNATSDNAEYNKNIDNNFTFTGDVGVTGTNAGTYTLDLSKEMKNLKNKNEKFAEVEFRFNPNNHVNTLVITPRTVVLTSGSGEKEYDGEALTNETVTVTGDGFVGGQGATYTFTGTQTDEGSSQNTFTYTLTGGALPGNYNIATNFGTLRVLAAEVIEEPEPPLAEPEEIEDDETPLAAPGGWALVNLISMVLTACTAGGMLVSYRKRNGKDDDLVRDSEVTEQKKSKFLGLIPGLGSIATFFLTEDLNSRMVMTDRWTVLMLAILGIAAALAWLTRNDEPKEDLGEI